jgi:hypothetical protein
MTFATVRLPFYSHRACHQGTSPKMLVHRQAAFTTQTYAHVIKETQQQLTDKMDAILKPMSPSEGPTVDS